ncbi:hypothetical protein ACAW74_25950 [Fibrella sp. WM1]|uniref:hypothetical protein n=1 Tax=Fibrella musci TaxID=3242485 RepID=UPI00352091B4
MVRFENEKIIIEVQPTGLAPLTTHLALLKSLMLVSRFVLDHAGESEVTLEALSTLHYTLGAALCEVDPAQLAQFEDTISK